MSRLINIGKSILLSGGIISHGSLTGYISDAARRAIGIGLAEFQYGAVHYFSKDAKILKRAVIQSVSQLAYGALRSYPRFIKYWEQVKRDKYLQTQSQTSLANKTGHYYQLIQEQQAVAKKKNYADTIVGRVVQDYLELAISGEGSYFDSKSGKIEQNATFGLVTFVDLQPTVQVSSKNNIVLTTVQGRDYSRKEYVSGGDFEITVSGKITSKCRNVQPYTLSCIAVEPSESVELKLARQEEVDVAIKHTNKWIKYVRMGADAIDPASLLKITRLWL